MALATGTRVGPYEILSSIGTGGMGAVYRARDTTLNRDVAVKVLPESFARDPERLARFAREANVLAALNHPNVAVIHGLEDADGQPALVMELVEGPTLAELIASRTTPQAPRGLDIGEACRVAAQIARALEAMHEKGIVHRDLKPANLKVRPDSVVKVLDFGLARVMDEAGAGPDGATATLGPTRVGTVMGTAAYMCPEQARGLPVDQTADVWAFGCVLYEMLAGRRAFDGDTYSDIIARIIEREPDWTGLPPGTPPAIRHLLKQLLAKDSRQRLREIREARVQIEDASARAHVPAVMRARTPGSMGRGWRTAAAVAAAILGVVLAGGLLWQSRSPDRPLPSAGATGPGARRVSTGGPASDRQEANEAFELAVNLQQVQNDIPRAQELLERALAIDPRFAEALRYHATNYAIQLINGYSNDTSLLYRAEEELRQVSQIAPDLPGLPSAWATVYLTQGRKELVPWEQLDRALEQDPTHINNRFWRGLAHWLAGRSGQARQEFQTILDRQPLFGPGRMFLGEVLREEGDLTGAIRELEKVQEQAPDNISAVHWLTLAYLDGGALDRARQLLEEKRPRFSRNYMWRATWALLLAVEGRHDEARPSMDDETLRFAGAAFPVTLTVAEFHAVLGDRSRAIEWLERTVRNGDERTDWFRRSPRLSSIREDARFHRIVEPVEARRRQETAGRPGL